MPPRRSLPPGVGAGIQATRPALERVSELLWPHLDDVISRLMCIIQDDDTQVRDRLSAIREFARLLLETESIRAKIVADEQHHQQALSLLVVEREDMQAASVRATNLYQQIENERASRKQLSQ